MISAGADATEDAFAAAAAGDAVVAAVAVRDSSMLGRRKTD